MLEFLNNPIVAGVIKSAIAIFALLTAFGFRARSRAARAAGSALMLHDWKDRSMWFELGAGTQP